MSDSSSKADAAHETAHEGPIKTPKQLIVAVVASFVVPVIVIVLLVQFVTTSKKPAAGSEAFSEQAIAGRIQPIGRVEIAVATGGGVLKTGEQVYQAQCTGCHAAGVVGAPKSGDAGAWAPRIKTGYDALLNSALKGKGAMAAQGGGAFSDLEVGRAVVYMVNKAGGNFPEPKAPAGDAAAAPAAATETAAAAAPAAPAAADAKPAAVAAAPTAAAAAPALYTQACSVCHTAGVAGAPKTGDKAAWAPRLATGVDGLTASAIKGKGAMPARGGAASASDADIKAVVTFMVNSVK